jgi:hypothetical protein
MLKHIGKHNERKVVVLFHKVPNEDHMCLITYSDVLHRMLHDEIMRTLESPVGQQAENLADALFRAPMADGRNPLEVLHKEGFMKKVQTSQVIMTPTAQAKIRLDELNKILDEMKTGEDAVKRLSEMDASAGMVNKKKNNSTPPRNVGEPNRPVTPTIVPPLQAGPNDVLTDEAIANEQLVQATRMRNEAKTLLAEAARLEGEAAAIAPSVVKTTSTSDTGVAKRKPGRPFGTTKKNDATAKQKAS